MGTLSPMCQRYLRNNADLVGFLLTHRKGVRAQSYKHARTCQNLLGIDPMPRFCTLWCVYRRTLLSLFFLYMLMYNREFWYCFGEGLLKPRLSISLLRIYLILQKFVIYASYHIHVWLVPPPKQIMMSSSNGSIFRVTGPLCGEFTGHRWIPRTKASDTELWYFLWSAPEWTAE